jgi:hypothetical protein
MTARKKRWGLHRAVKRSYVEGEAIIPIRRPIMKRILLALALFACLPAAAAYPAFFPHDVIDEEGVQMLEMMNQIRGILETQRAIIRALPPEKQDEVMRDNARMIERIDAMIARAGAAAGKFVPPYARSNELAQFLRSTIQRK